MYILCRVGGGSIKFFRRPGCIPQKFSGVVSLPALPWTWKRAGNQKPLKTTGGRGNQAVAFPTRPVALPI